MSYSFSSQTCLSSSLLTVRSRQTRRPQAPAARWWRRQAVVVRAATEAAPASSQFTPVIPSRPLIVQSMVGDDGGPPRFTCPIVPSMTAQNREQLPLMIYLPGIDGTGLAASRQFPSLLQGFDLRAFVTPAHDRTNFAEKVELVKAFLRDEVPRHPPTRPVYLLGESFGGVLAVAVAAECGELVDRVVLVNPATSYPRSLWPLIGPLLPQIPAELYPLLPVLLAPVLGNPVNLLAAGVDSSASVRAQAAQLVQSAFSLLQQLPMLATLLPPETLAWKLEMLAQGNAYIAPQLPAVKQRVLVLVGDRDVLIPSAREGPRLQRELPRAHTRLMRGHSHALLQEAGVDLLTIMREEGFYVSSRRMSAPLKQRGGPSGHGPAAPIELPTDGELNRYAERTTRVVRRLSSPVFVSTSPDGRRALGLGHIPTGRPLILVGNHQTLAVDLGPLCEEFLRERGIMLRGLAHPIIFQDQQQQGQVGGRPGAGAAGSGSSSNGAAAGLGTGGGEQLGTPVTADGGSNGSSSGPWLAPWDITSTFSTFFSGQTPLGQLDPFNQGGMGGGGRGPGGRAGSQGSSQSSSFKDFMTTFGAVPVSAFNFHRLLQNGEAVLLFPGGVREAYKLKGEEYQLFWPERTEFIRMAARFGATIVPFAGVGVDDSLNLILDSKEVEQLPLVGQYIQRNTGQTPQARQGMTYTDELEEKFVAPLALPRFPPSRMYFVFQQPITTDPAHMKDRARCEELYRQVKASVEDGITFLQQGRAKDPYADFQKRVFYETIWGGRRQAPTFPIN